MEAPENPFNDEETATFLKVSEPRPPQGLAKLGLNPSLCIEICKMAMPVVLGMLTQTAINILDTVMVGHLPKELANPGQAAIGLSLPIMWLVGGCLSSLWVGTQAITSRRVGEGQEHNAGATLTNSLLLAIIGSILATGIALLIAEPILFALYADEVVAQTAVDYINLRFLGIGAMVCTFSYKSFFDGTGRTYMFMVAALIMNILNVFLNYIFIFGSPLLGLEQMGAPGAAIASVISAYIGLIILVVWSLKKSLRQKYQYYASGRLNKNVLMEILRLSVPNGVATIVVMTGFEAFYWVVGRVNDAHALPGNPVIATANQVLVTVVMLTFMTALAFGSATAAMVGQSLGAKRPQLAEEYAWNAVKIGAYLAWIYGIILYCFPENILALVNSDPQIIAIATPTLQGMAAFQGFIAMAVIFAQMLYGIGHAKFVMYVEFCLHLLVMSPIAYLFGIVFDLGLSGIYAGPGLYVMILLIATSIKFFSGDWKELEI
ncbi:MAG: MATE family efflux transporter [Myxococcota bacterium]|jgi:putative MATE family efflux protein|nr:MATE family efflux transporter [Myxococcota bacterium]